MTATVITTPDGKRVEVRCDTCQREAPSAAEIMAGHGLMRMGWHCAGGTHICPECPHPEGDAR